MDTMETVKAALKDLPADASMPQFLALLAAIETKERSAELAKLMTRICELQFATIIARVDDAIMAGVYRASCVRSANLTEAEEEYNRDHEG